VSKAAAIRVSVTGLANFSCRQGDLMPVGVVGPSAKEGMIAHKQIQTAAIKAAQHADSDDKADLFDEPGLDLAQCDGKTVEAEVALSRRCSIGGVDVHLSGRVDLIDYRSSKLSEIKTTLVPAEQLPDSQHALQWAQLYLYGFLFLDTALARKLSIEVLSLELIHVNLRSRTQESEIRTLHKQELINHAMDALDVYVDWISCVEQWRKRLAASAAKVDFPYQEFRRGQRDMAAAVYRAARDSSSLMVEAPTGIGKTISGIFPAAKAMGEGQIKQVVYLTAKVAGRLSAMQSLAHLSDAGLELTAIQIRAKHATCFCSNGLCERDEAARCPMTLGFFDRLPAARKELLALGVISGEQLDTVAWDHQLCPFELALQLLPWTQVVIADYNYVFDPMVRLPHFSESRKDSLLLVDEAHNLVDRSRSMYSAKLSSQQCTLAAGEYRRTHPLLASALEDVSRQLLEGSLSQCEPETVSAVTSSSLRKAAVAAVELLLNAFGQAPALPDSAVELFKELCRYVAIDELFGEQHRCITRVEEQGKRRVVALTLYCLDASKALEKQYNLFKAQVLFSATLRPGVFYRDTLGLSQSTAQLVLQSPFQSDRACYAIVDWIDTRYRQRNQSLTLLLDLIKQSTQQKSGNYLVFFPSYAYLEQVHHAFVEQFPDVDTWCQTPTQSKQDHNQLLDQLDVTAHRVGFAILGGVFGEGIDYIGDRLIGVIIVGTGLPGLDVQTQLVSDHYRESGRNGFDFAYRYPGFTRVLQTAGRLIRHELDKGIVILVDDRFKQVFYQKLYPNNWVNRMPGSQRQLTQDIKDFWATLPG